MSDDMLIFLRHKTGGVVFFFHSQMSHFSRLDPFVDVLVEFLRWRRSLMEMQRISSSMSPGYENHTRLRW